MSREGPGGLEFIDISNAHGAATVCTQGAQLLHWQPRGATLPVTFLAEAAQYAPGKPVRGGIPVCWPWFGPHPDGSTRPSHGFARNLTWQAAAPTPVEGGATLLVLTLVDDEHTRTLWPHAFRLECRISVGAALALELVTANTGSQAFTISEALHTYFLVGDIGAVEVRGLDSTAYADTADAGRRKRQSGAVGFPGEVDRVFLGTEADCTIVDPGLQRRILVSKTGSRSTVVWNPGPDKAARLADLGTGAAAGRGWRQMVCVESGNALDDCVTVPPGQHHVLAVRYALQPL